MSFYTEKFKNNNGTKAALIMIGSLILMLIIIALIPTPEEIQVSENMTSLDNGKVVKMATAPDGTVLWAKKIEDDIIYFPSAQKIGEQ